MGTKVARISENIHAKVQELADREGVSFAEAHRSLIEGAPAQAGKEQPPAQTFNPEDFRITEDVDEIRQELAELHEAQAETYNALLGLSVGIEGLMVGQDVLAEHLEAEGMKERRLEAMRQRAELLGLPASLRDPVIAVIEAKLSPTPALTDGSEA